MELASCRLSGTYNFKVGLKGKFVDPLASKIVQNKQKGKGSLTPE